MFFISFFRYLSAFLLHFIIYLVHPYHKSNLAIGGKSILTLSFNWVIQWVVVVLSVRERKRGLSVSNTVQFIYKKILEKQVS